MFYANLDANLGSLICIFFLIISFLIQNTLSFSHLKSKSFCRVVLIKQNEDVSINKTRRSASDESTNDDENLNDSEGN